MKRILYPAFWLLSTASAYAQDTIEVPDPLKNASFGSVTEAIIDGLKMIAVPVCVIMIIWGAIQIMTAGGNEQRISDGRKTITYAAIGMAIIILGQTIIDFIKQTLQD